MVNDFRSARSYSNLGPVHRDSGLVTGQSQERPIVAIHVVLEIKNARETGPCDQCLAPGTVRILRADQISDAVLDALSMRLLKSAQPKQSPCCLGRSADSPAPQL